MRPCSSRAPSFEAPAQVVSAASAQRDAPGIAGKPGVLEVRGADHLEAPCIVQSDDLADTTNWVFEAIFTRSTIRTTLYVRCADVVTAGATQQALGAPLCGSEGMGGSVLPRHLPCTFLQQQLLSGRREPRRAAHDVART